jgi:hypothetical protein
MIKPKVFLLVTLAMAAACGGGSVSSTDGAAQTSGSGGAGAGGSGGAGASGSGGAGASGSGGAETGGGAGSGGDPSGPSVTGVLEDEMGQPIGGAAVLCCSLTACYSDSSNGDGRFSFSFEAELPVDFVLKSLEDSEAMPRRAVTMFPLNFVDVTPIDVGALFVPSLPAGAVLGPKSSDPQTLEVGDGLKLIVNSADLSPPLDVLLYDIAARRVPQERVPPLPDLGAEEVIAVYALYPFATTSESPIGVRAPSDLPPGTPVRFRSMSEFDGKLSAPAEGQADGAQVKTEPSAGIEELTWLVISK